MNAGIDLSLALDPVLFAQATGLTPDPWQADLLRSRSGRMLLNCCRQSGKSTVTATKATHRALYRPGSLVLLLSPSLRQSQELFRKVLDTYRALDRPTPAEAENKLTLELQNGSRIVALPGKEQTVRGYSGVDLLIIDEASRVLDDLYRSVRPMLAVSEGELIALSTPWGKRGWWFDAWVSSAPWERYEVPASKCPRIKAEFLQEEERALGWHIYTQEYGCQFIEPEGAIFRYEDIEAMFADDVVPLFPTSDVTTPQAEEEDVLEGMLF